MAVLLIYYLKKKLISSYYRVAMIISGIYILLKKTNETIIIRKNKIKNISYRSFYRLLIQLSQFSTQTKY